ncbi:hypothetical protein RFI_04624, partial [Reticulomyxa filosa]
CNILGGGTFFFKKKKAKFHPREGIDKLFELVSDCLDPELASHGVEYGLYLPPKVEITVYPKNKKNNIDSKPQTFRDYQMIPASMVRLLFANATDALKTYQGSYLKPELVQSISTDFTLIGSSSNATKTDESNPLDAAVEKDNTVNTEQKVDERDKKKDNKNQFLKSLVRR